MIDGNGYKWTNQKEETTQMPNPKGGYYDTGVGHSGNGHARITNLNTEYSNDGLILHYDAINNTGSKHDSSSTTWKDLSGHGKDGILIGGTWHDNYLQLNGNGEGINVGDNLLDLFKDDNTIEMTVMFDNGDTRDIFIGNYNQPHNINYEVEWARYRVWINDGEGDWHGSRMEDLQNLFQDVTYVLDKSESKITVYRNYDNKEFFTDPEIGAYDYDWDGVYIGRDARTNFTSINGKIYSVRVYNRALSDEEIHNNYVYDKLKFNIE